MKILLGYLAFFAASHAALGGDAFVDRNSGITFPETIATLTFEAKEEYDDPKLGYRLRYGDVALLKLDIYVYDKGYTDIRNGVSSKRVRDEFEEARSVIRAMEAIGKYQGVRELAKQTKSFGPQKTQFLWARYQYQQTPGEGVLHVGKRISETYLTGARGRFVKVRITVADDGLTNWENISDRYIEAITRLLETKP